MRLKYYLLSLIFIFSSVELIAQTCECCFSPVVQPTAISFSQLTASSITGSFSASTGADGYLVIKSTTPSLTAFPINLQVYTAGTSFGTGTVVDNISTTSFTASALSAFTTYYFYVFAYRVCALGKRYMALNPLSGSASTLSNCNTPVSQPTSLSFGTVTSTSIAGSFTASTADEYLVIISANNSLSATPAGGIVYNVNDNLGGGQVIARGNSISFSRSGLSANTPYYFFVFALNNSNCVGGPVYKTDNPLTGNQTTLLPSCTAPSVQPTSLVFSNITSNSLQGSFTVASGVTGYTVLMSTSASPSVAPVNGTNYSGGAILGNSTVISTGAGTTFTASSLSSNTTYYFFVYSYSNTNCIGGPVYLTTSPLTGNQATPFPNCITPSSQPTSLTFSTITSSSIQGSFSAASGATGYTVLMSTSSSPTVSPANGTSYSAGSTLGNSTVISSGTGTSFTASSLSANTTYYFFVYSYSNSNCLGGPAYLTTSPLSGSQATQLPSCVSPSAQPTSLVFSNITSSSIQGTFTAVGGVTGYIILMSTSSSPSSAPANGTTYTAGATLGNSTIVSSGTGTSFTASSLSSNTTYYFFVYSYNNTSCVGGPVYLTTAPLSANQATQLPACSNPSAQPTSLVFSNVTTSSIQGSFTAVGGITGYTVLMSTSASPTVSPVDGTTYTAGGTLGNSTIISSGTGTTFTASGLTFNTTYYFFVFSYLNTNCLGGPNYLITSPLTGSQATALPNCTTPAAQPTSLVFSNISYNSMDGSFTAASGISEYLVLMAETSTVSNAPVNGTTYTAGATLGNATVVKSGTGTTFTATGLSPNILYYFFVYSYSNSGCLTGPKYLTTSPLNGSQVSGAPTVSSLNFYFGNLHAHSSYSDGNQDNTTKIPADDYAYAKTAQCMDFLGICEHNHATAGMNINDWQPGITQANAATTSTFVALHGMEWGVISTGGHAVVYGIDSLIGWETNNYQIFVANGNFTGTGGLFSILKRNGNAFAFLAHPNYDDYDSIMYNYNSIADSVVIGSAVESGPAFSITTNYTDYPSQLGYITYYRNMLSRGYHIGPTMDQDTHNMTFGTANTNRLVILATSLTKQNLLMSMKQRRFYASNDCSAQVTFSILNQPMGTIITHTGAPVISVSTITSSSVSSIKVWMGVPGSGNNATTLTSTTSGSLTYTDNAITIGSTRYYYLEITESDGKKIITAPIWYTRQ